MLPIPRVSDSLLAEVQPSAASPFATCARGFSLIEVLIASTLALIAMGSVAALFGIYGRTVSQSQTIVDLNARIRNAASQLRQDLHGVTVAPKPWVRPEANAGYFQIIEGTNSDTIPSGSLGDVDDQLMATIAALGEPFVGSLQPAPPASELQSLECPFAEVVWFCEASGQTFENKPLYNLFRRQLLVSGAPATGAFSSGVAAAIDRNKTDLSCRDSGGTKIVNSLSDLSKPANRFWKVFTDSGTPKPLQGARIGEDIILGSVIAFDVRAYMPGGTSYTDQPFNTDYQENVAPAEGDPLRGVEIRIRCVEPTSKQIRQVTVVHSFEGM